jgi:hypothetical protein
MSASVSAFVYRAARAAITPVPKAGSLASAAEIADSAPCRLPSGTRPVAATATWAAIEAAMPAVIDQDETSPVPCVE